MGHAILRVQILSLFFPNVFSKSQELFCYKCSHAHEAVYARVFAHKKALVWMQNRFTLIFFPDHFYSHIYTTHNIHNHWFKHRFFFMLFSHTFILIVNTSTTRIYVMVIIQPRYNFIASNSQPHHCFLDYTLQVFNINRVN